MTIGEGAGVPAGWYPDPVDPARLRRWDGKDWTEDVAAAASAAPAVPEPEAAPEPQPEPQRLVSAPQAPPLPPRPPSAPVAEPEQEAVPEPAHANGFDDLPEWATLPGLTLPPDLSSIPGLSPRSPLPTPHFEDAENETPRPSPQFGSPLPTLPPPGAEPEPAPEPTPAASAPSPPSPPSSAESPSLSRRELRDIRDREAAAARASSAGGPSAVPYAPPPKGGQFSAPPPPGIAYTPPPPGEAQPASALAPPPAARRDAPGDAALGAPQFASVPAPAATRQHGDAQSEIPVARARPAGFGVPQSRGTSTVGVWVSAVVPAVHFAVVYLVFSVLAQPFLPGIQWGVLAGPVIFALIFAAVDRRQLIGNGHDDAPSALFAIIPPLYLIVRIAKLGKASVAPLVVWVVLQAAAAGAVVFLMPAVLKAAIGAF